MKTVMARSCFAFHFILLSSLLFSPSTYAYSTSKDASRFPI